MPLTHVPDRGINYSGQLRQNQLSMAGHSILPRHKCSFSRPSQPDSLTPPTTTPYLRRRDLLHFLFVFTP